MKSCFENIKIIKCPECKSNKIVKNGFRYNRSGKLQRYLCKKCGHIFQEENKDE